MVSYECRTAGERFVSLPRAVWLPPAEISPRLCPCSAAVSAWKATTSATRRVGRSLPRRGWGQTTPTRVDPGRSRPGPGCVRSAANPERGPDALSGSRWWWSSSFQPACRGGWEASRTAASCWGFYRRNRPVYSHRAWPCLSSASDSSSALEWAAFGCVGRCGTGSSRCSACHPQTWDVGRPGQNAGTVARLAQTAAASLVKCLPWRTRQWSSGCLPSCLEWGWSRLYSRSGSCHSCVLGLPWERVHCWPVRHSARRMCRHSGHAFVFAYRRVMDQSFICCMKTTIYVCHTFPVCTQNTMHPQAKLYKSILPELMIPHLA